MASQEEIRRILAVSLRPILERLQPEWDQLEEIRLRVNEPLAVKRKGEVCFVSEHGIFCEAGEAHITCAAEIQETMDYLSSYSRYAFEEKIRQGFLTIPGGHRIGLCGRTILERDMVKTITPVMFLNIRIARQVPGCGRQVIPWLLAGGRMLDTLVLSPPGLGKTTLLRDLICLLSEGEEVPPHTVGVVDERSELAACYQGIPQNQLGSRTDVLDGCPKAEGMMMLVRTMSPDVIAVDEVGSLKDCQAMEYAMNCGCRMLTTVHGANLEEVKRRPVIGDWMRNHRFQRYVFIEREKENFFYRVCNEQAETLWRGERI